MIDRHNALPVTHQCQLLSLNRSTAYYQAKGVSEDDLKIMRRIDEMHLKRPFYGSRRIRDWLVAENHEINRKRVQRLMRFMGIIALYPKKGTNHPGKGHRIYPYLLKGLNIDRPNQVFVPTLRTYRWRKGLCIWSRSWTGTVARSCPGVYLTPWIQTFVLTP